MRDALRLARETVPPLEDHRRPRLGRHRLGHRPMRAPSPRRSRAALSPSTPRFRATLDSLKPDVLVDARMRKRAVTESQRGLARVTIGLGPNFHAGVTCDVAVETIWDALGTVIRDGVPLPLTGEPRELGG